MKSAVILMAAVLAGCSAPPKTPIAQPSSSAVMKGPFPGIITSLPKAGDYFPRIAIEHCLIPGLGPGEGDYAKSDDGRVTMPFWTDISAASFHEKESVQFSLKVNWDDDRPVVITAMDHVTGNKPLECGKAK